MTKTRLAPGIGGLFVLFCVDRIMKWWSLYRLADGGEWAVKNRLGFILERNQGISYSLPFPQTILMIVLIVIVIVLVTAVVFAYRRQHWFDVLALASIILGACSNLIDRMKYGYVVDYVTLTGWPVFNLADILILFGAVWLVLRLVKPQTAQR